MTPTWFVFPGVVCRPLFFSAVQLPARKTNQSPEVVALAQSSDHVLNFFKMLRMELAFYVSCLNLRDRLAAKEEPVCFPAPRSIGERTLSFRGLYDVCLSLHIKDREVGNGVDASGKSLLVVTGTNRGGKSTFLRSIGLAQLMMQSGMFVGAESFEATLCPALFTRYKQEEDATKKSGKFDEELARMSGIVNHVLPNSLVLFNESFSATNEREGSEIARQIVTALVEKRVGVFYVTHLHKFARGFFNRNSDGAMLLVPFSDRHSGFPAKSREPTDQNLVACSLCACAACAAQQH